MKKCAIFLLLALLIFGMVGCTREETTYERTVNGETYVVDMANHTLTHEGKVYKYETVGIRVGAAFQGGSLRVTYPDGTWYEQEIGSDGYLVLGTERTSSNYNEKTYPRGEDLCYVLEKETLRAAGAEDKSSADDGTKIVICVVLVALGALNIFLPELGWWISVGRWIKDAEPSEHAVTHGRIAGVALIVMGLGVLILM